jgi:hypothetical protein
MIFGMVNSKNGRNNRLASRTQSIALQDTSNDGSVATVILSALLITTLLVLLIPLQKAFADTVLPSGVLVSQPSNVIKCAAISFGLKGELSPAQIIKKLKKKIKLKGATTLLGNKLNRAKICRQIVDLSSNTAAASTLQPLIENSPTIWTPLDGPLVITGSNFYPVTSTSKPATAIFVKGAASLIQYSNITVTSKQIQVNPPAQIPTGNFAVALHVINYEQSKGKAYISEALNVEIQNSGEDNDGGDDDPIGPTPTSSPTPTPYQPPSLGAHIATIEVQYPQNEYFVLRSVLPIPPHLLTKDMLDSGVNPFSITGPTGESYPAQTEMVAKGADGTLDAIELLARVRRVGTPNAMAQYKVFFAPNNEPSTPLSGTIQQFMAVNPVEGVSNEIKPLLQTGKLKVRAKDVFGNTYERDLLLGTLNVERHGRAALQLSSYGPMLPVAGSALGAPTGALPHFFNVHAFITISFAEALKVDLLFSNGAANQNKNASVTSDDPLAALYFRTVEVVVPKDFTTQQYLKLYGSGTEYIEGQNRVLPLITPLAGGKMHEFASLKQVARRIAFSPNHALGIARAQELLQEYGAGFAADGFSTTNPAERLYSFFNPDLGGFFPQGITLPQYTYATKATLRAQYATKFQQYKTVLESPNCWMGTTECVAPFYAGPLGFYGHEYGIDYGGATSGSEIHNQDGTAAVAAASREELLRMMVELDTNLVRQSRIFRADGNPIRFEDYIQANGAMNIRFYNDFDFNFCSTCDPMGYKQVAKYQADYVVANNLLPPYKAIADKYDPHDNQHLIRFTRTSSAMAWLANDAVGRLQARAEGEYAHLFMSERPIYFTGSTPKYAPESITTLTPTQPGKGVKWGRGHSHELQAALAAVALDRGDFADRKKAFFTTILDQLFIPGQIPCTGGLAYVLTKNSENLYNYIPGNENAFFNNMLLSLHRRVFDYADPVRADALHNVLIGSLAFHHITNYSWNVDAKAPRTLGMVSHKDTPHSVYCNWNEVPAEGKAISIGYGNSAGEFLYNIGLLYKLTNDKKYLADAYAFMTTKTVNQPTLKAQLTKWASQYPNYVNSSFGPLWALVQQEDYQP